MAINYTRFLATGKCQKIFIKILMKVRLPIALIKMNLEIIDYNPNLNPNLNLEKIDYGALKIEFSDSIQNETQLIRAGDIWKEKDLLESISYNIKNDSYYIVSLHPLQFIVPPNLNNTKSNTGPKMILGKFLAKISN